MRAYTYNNEPEAQKIRYMLEAQNIPCEIHSFESWGYDGAFRGQIGMGEIVVPDDMIEKAREVIDRFVSEEEGGPDREDPELKRIKLENQIEQLRTLRFVIYAVLIVSFLLVVRLGFFGIIVMGALAISAVYGKNYIEKELQKIEQELKKL